MPKVGIILLTRQRLLAGWSEYEVLMETPLSAGVDWRNQIIARRVEPGCLVAYGEAAHG
jgi:hypothetical protein